MRTGALQAPVLQRREEDNKMIHEGDILTCPHCNCVFMVEDTDLMPIGDNPSLIVIECPQCGKVVAEDGVTFL